MLTAVRMPRGHLAISLLLFRCTAAPDCVMVTLLGVFLFLFFFRDDRSLSSEIEDTMLVPWNVAKCTGVAS